MDDKKLLDLMAYIRTEHSGVSYEDLCGREFYKRILGGYVPEPEADEALEFDKTQCFLLYGPFGAGKSSIINAHAGEMVSAGYSYLELDFGRIPADKVRAMLDMITGNWLGASPCYIYLKNIEALVDTRPLVDFYEHAESNAENTLILAATAKGLDGLGWELRRMFSAYYVGLPTADDRRAYFEVYLGTYFNHNSVKAMNYLVDETEGYDYMQMYSMVNQIKTSIKYQVLTGEQSLDKAMNMLKQDMLEEIFAMAEPKKAVSAAGISSAELMAMIASINMAAQAQQSETMEAGRASRDVSIDSEKRPVDALEDLRQKYSSNKVFDKGVSFYKGK